MKSTREVVLWKDVETVLQRRINLALDALAGCEGQRELGVQQGRIAAYREMLDLPAALVAGEEMDQAELRNREAIIASQDPRTWAHPFYAKGR
jgi:hypothetical protein